MLDYIIAWYNVHDASAAFHNRRRDLVCKIHVIVSMGIFPGTPTTDFELAEAGAAASQTNPPAFSASSVS